MFSIDLECPPASTEFTIAELWEAACTGIIELDNHTLRVFFDDDARQPELLSRFGGEAKPADTRDWVAFAREHLQPMEIGQRIFVIPEWRDDPTPPGRIRIVINAGLAFGTGAHETTRLCLEALERHCEAGAFACPSIPDPEGKPAERFAYLTAWLRARLRSAFRATTVREWLRELSDAPESIAVTHFPPDPRDPKLFPRPTVIDIGTGSGILSEAAIRLGAGRVFAGDTDPEAVAVAKENFARAGVQVELFTGSADAVASGVADLIVANISPAWIAELAPEWLRILKPGGIAILSGFEAGDVPAIAAAVEKAGGRVRGRWGEREWAMLEIAAKPEHLS